MCEDCTDPRPLITHDDPETTDTIGGDSTQIESDRSYSGNSTHAHDGEPLIVDKYHEHPITDASELAERMRRWIEYAEDRWESEGRGAREAVGAAKAMAYVVRCMLAAQHPVSHGMRGDRIEWPEWYMDLDPEMDW